MYKVLIQCELTEVNEELVDQLARYFVLLRTPEFLHSTPTFFLARHLYGVHAGQILGRHAKEVQNLNDRGVDHFHHRLNAEQANDRRSAGSRQRIAGGRYRIDQECSVHAHEKFLVVTVKGFVMHAMISSGSLACKSPHLCALVCTFRTLT